MDYPSLYSIKQKPPSIDLKFEHAAPALLDELFKLDISMTSSESEPVEAILCAEIKNAEGAGNGIMCILHSIEVLISATLSISHGRLHCIHCRR